MADSPSACIRDYKPHLEGVLGKLEKQEGRLRFALDQARHRREEYNLLPHIRADARRAAMGADPITASQSGAPYSKLNTALGSYGEWAKAFLEHQHRNQTDAAMRRLKTKLSEDGGTIDVVLGVAPEQHARQEDDDLSDAFASAGSAIETERILQAQDALSRFPCTLLIDAGQSLLEAWQAETEAMRNLLQVCDMLKNDREAHVESLCSTGKLFQEKDDAVRELCDARQAHGKAVRWLKTFMDHKDYLEDEDSRDMLEQVKKRSKCTSLEELRHTEHDKLNACTAATLKLTGRIQRQFPEVILFVGRGLPDELGMLWRPAQSPDLFEIEDHVARAPHNVWKVRMGGKSFAIKEYSIGQADHLRTCLKEATVIHRCRHPAIVEIHALFQGSGNTSGNFYMQMPWYEHGSIDKWVESSQKPEWNRVRSVLLDALHGLSHLHENRIIHGDIKPANILVDSRERGRLADFDISIDTKLRTAYVTKAMTMQATALGMTDDFAAPELKESNQATRQTDMFAFGTTLSCLRTYCEPQDGGFCGEAQGSDCRTRREADLR
jgi:serine/threonine protein kinase